MTGLQRTTTATAALCFSTFAVGAYTLFDRGGQPSRGLTAIKISALLSAPAELIVMISARDPRRRSWIAAQGMFAGSLTLFAWAAATTRTHPLTVAYADDVPDHLNQNGPYRWIRHPFYASYLLAYLAGLVATGNPALVPVVVCMTGLYTNAAQREQNKFAASPVHHEYRDYRAQAGMFAPRLPLVLSWVRGIASCLHVATREGWPDGAGAIAASCDSA